MTLAVGILILEVGLIVHLLVYTVLTGISPVPTTPAVKEKMLEVAPEHIDGLILDLGSGWGALTFAFARKYPHSRVIGYELSPLPLCFCYLRQCLRPLPNLTFQRGDYRNVPFDQAELVVCYLFIRGMRELRPKLEHELNAGSVVISNTFSVPGWAADQVWTAEDQYSTQVFVYEMPAKVSLFQTAEPALFKHRYFV
jgi:trans-aconitate methyltransferase